MTENDYAVIDAAKIGCIGPESDIWFKSCPAFEVAGDVMGELHLPALNLGHTISIGGALGDLSTSGCGCVLGRGQGNLPYAGCGFLGVTCPEASPRGAPSYPGEAEYGIALHGAILISEDHGLHGQIIIDAARTLAYPPEAQRPQTHLRGVVRVGSITLSTGETNPLYHLPAYLAPSPALGGGAIGLVPFGIYPSDCDPPDLGGDGGIRSVDRFNSGELDILIPHYGPVKSAGLPQTPFIFLSDANSGAAIETSTTQSVSGRTVRIHRAEEGLATGKYGAANYWATPAVPENLLCDGIALQNLPVLHGSVRFRLWCTLDGDVHPCDIATEGNPDPLAGPDGFVTGADFEVYIIAYFTGLQRADGALIADLCNSLGGLPPRRFRDRRRL